MLKLERLSDVVNGVQIRSRHAMSLVDLATVTVTVQSLVIAARMFSPIALVSLNYPHYVSCYCNNISHTINIMCHPTLRNNIIYFCNRLQSQFTVMEEPANKTAVSFRARTNGIMM